MVTIGVRSVLFLSQNASGLPRMNYTNINLTSVDNFIYVNVYGQITLVPRSHT